MRGQELLCLCGTKAHVGEQRRWLQKHFVFSCLWTAVGVGGTLTWSGCLQPAWIMLTIAYEPLRPEGRTPLTRCSWLPQHGSPAESRADARSPSQGDVNDPVKTVLDFFVKIDRIAVLVEISATIHTCSFSFYWQHGKWRCFKNQSSPGR